MKNATSRIWTHDLSHPPALVSQHNNYTIESNNKYTYYSLKYKNSWGTAVSTWKQLALFLRSHTNPSTAQSHALGPTTCTTPDPQSLHAVAIGVHPQTLTNEPHCWQMLALPEQKSTNHNWPAMTGERCKREREEKGREKWSVVRGKRIGESTAQCDNNDNDWPFTPIQENISNASPGRCWCCPCILHH